MTLEATAASLKTQGPSPLVGRDVVGAAGQTHGDAFFTMNSGKGCSASGDCAIGRSAAPRAGVTRGNPWALRLWDRLDIGRPAERKPEHGLATGRGVNSQRNSQADLRQL